MIPCVQYPRPQSEEIHVGSPAWVRLQACRGNWGQGLEPTLEGGESHGARRASHGMATSCGDMADRQARRFERISYVSGLPVSSESSISWGLDCNPTMFFVLTHLRMRVREYPEPFLLREPTIL